MKHKFPGVITWELGVIQLRSDGSWYYVCNTETGHIIDQDKNRKKMREAALGESTKYTR